MDEKMVERNRCSNSASLKEPRTNELCDCDCRNYPRVEERLSKASNGVINSKSHNSPRANFRSFLAGEKKNEANVESLVMVLIEEPHKAGSLSLCVLIFRGIMPLPRASTVAFFLRYGSHPSHPSPLLARARPFSFFERYMQSECAIRELACRRYST